MIELMEQLLALASKSHLCCSEFQKNWYPREKFLGESPLKAEHDILVRAEKMLAEMKKY
tara:strand:- start:8934 stop:9110 length:177 start_codon:yes stop_codon:yes gene_type:complete